MDSDEVYIDMNHFLIRTAHTVGTPVVEGALIEAARCWSTRGLSKSFLELINSNSQSSACTQF